ncbi:ornithine cyclodeaminase [Lentzea sp. NBRC 105346]|uniref:ornithine cyclodeaminase family protein n=1 Tax=Lentzea sp. NBRC 105346 TaxID=3032205 RepID=UPI0024A2ED25|nr:ornithine cyclodeaminase family protein [Lentzea sp. NBRC 105346]GLZ33799.1 ornithine cyclodeaminase [Lentzea sp. NBRC 105346]
MKESIDAVRSAFIELAAGNFEQPQRLSFSEGRALVMTAHHTPTRSTVVKTLSVEPDRNPVITGTIVYSDPSGQFTADAVALTTLRTGAVVGVATDLLADKDASSLALIGAGAQAADQVRAVHAVRPLERLTVYTRSIAHAEALLELLRDELPGTALDTAPSAADAVSNADVVCTATPSTTPLFPAEALPARVHVNAIGSYRPGMRELPEELLTTSDLVVVDEVGAAMAEAGEIIAAVEAGVLKVEQLCELGAALGNPPDPGGRTVFKSVGVACQDWAVARLLSRRSISG